MTARQSQGKKQFDQLQATSLYCPKCRQATPVCQRLLLFLPDGELHEYLCQYCGASVGTKKVRQQQPIQLVVP
ncbi:MAG: cytoplasmic protein [Syntrophobacteria bacterium]